MPSADTLRLADLSIQAASSNQRVLYTEYGSASCGGVDGLSDSFAAGIFTLDSLFELAQKNIHSVAISGNPRSHCNLLLI